MAVVAALVSVLVPTVHATRATPPEPDPGHVGTWSAVQSWPLIAIHAVLTGDGKVLTYGSSATGQQTGLFIYDVWTPGSSAAAGHETLPNTTGTDLFCNVQVVDPNTDRVLMFGGDLWDASAATNQGNPDIVTFDPRDATLSHLPGMLRPRFYASAVTLLNGDIYVQGGKDGADRAELWHKGESRLLPFDTSGLHFWYPRLFALPDGRVFGIDGKGEMFTIDESLTTLTRLGAAPPSLANWWWTSAEFTPGLILAFGGLTDESFIIDTTTDPPTVRPSGDLSSTRIWATATILPDGRVLATGGSAAGNKLIGVNNTAEIWDPATGEWQPSGDAALARLYHSTALLLPDGRVLVAGGGAPGPLNNTNAEIYSPEYLTNDDGSPAVRPVITAVSATRLSPGADVFVDVESSVPLDRVTLVKTGSVTHSVNFDQRFVELPLEHLGNLVRTRLPAAGVLTPGNYLLQVIDADGVPSVAKIIHIAPAASPTLEALVPSATMTAIRLGAP